jgi:glycosyltransferase involved in cell wall biosynthesis
MRVAINLLTENPRAPSGAQQFWQHVIAAMIPLLNQDDELFLIVSPECRSVYEKLFGEQVHPIMVAWSNERRLGRIFSEHFLIGRELKRNGIEVYNTGIAPFLLPREIALVVHIKTMHAFVTPRDLSFLRRTYRRELYPYTIRHSDAVILNSESIRTEVNRYLAPPPEKLHLVYEAVNHDIFVPSKSDRAVDIAQLKSVGIDRPYVLFLSSLWPYKNAEGLIRAFSILGAELANHQLVFVGGDSDPAYGRMLREMCRNLGLADRAVFCGRVPHVDAPLFYRNADVFVYPSFNETFGLTILEAMACGCPVVTSNISSMPEIAGDAALLVDPGDPDAMAGAIRKALSLDVRNGLVEKGLKRAAEFTWAECGRRTLDVYRQDRRHA